MELQAIKNRFGIIGNAAALNNAIGVAVRVASTNLTVLITGESGVGKEVFSHIIHQLGSRKHSPFIAVNCGAIPEGTIDSELFGHEKGAFTGASEQRKGYFETVAGGTIFLDEVGELPHGTQARLLRVLETGEFIRVGSSKVMKTDVRVVAATNVNLQTAVSTGRFREDLYYRLNTVPISIPPLRERNDDIYLLFRKFSLDFAERHRISPILLNEEARQLILKYTWPGNVRQLKNVAEQVSILATERELSAEQLISIVPDIANNKLPVLVQDFNKFENSSSGFSEREILYKLIFDLKKDLNDLKKFVFDIAKGEMAHASFQEGEMPVQPLFTPNVSAQPIIIPTENHPVIMQDKPSASYQEHEVVEENLSIVEKEKELIIKALKKHRNKRKDAAADLGISERTLYRKIKEYQLDK